MNLPITPHCRLDTQFIYHRHALYQITTLLYLATKGRAPNRVVTVAHDSKVNYCLRQTSAWLSVWNTSNFRSTIYTVFVSTGNDPFAGSPTKTLLRLLLPLNGKVQPTSSGPATRLPGSRAGRAPRASPDRSIGRSDGRCVQRAGT